MVIIPTARDPYTRGSRSATMTLLEKDAAMPKGFFTQTAIILLREKVSIEAIAAAMGEYSHDGLRPAMDEWAFGGPSFVVTFNEEDNGKIAIDVVDQPWPDEMGDPETDSTIFGAWASGQFGPFTYPGALARAMQQSWVWEDGHTAPGQHVGFIRVRSSYVIGRDEDAPIYPEDYDAYEDLAFVTEIAATLTELPEAICYFNPNGEVVRDIQGVDESIDFANDNELPPHELWSNVRLFKLNDEWSIMDSVGNSQLELPDCEACFHTESYKLEDVDNFLRNCFLYLIDEGDTIADGDVSEGPGDISWQARRFDSSLVDPPRNVIRWFPQDDHKVPEELLIDEEEEEIEE